ncbi:MAG TPA: YncE family protein [Candidatus Angelobacter sp.]
MKKALFSLATLLLSTFPLSLQLRADSVLTTINVGNGGLTGIAANPATNKIYAAIDNQDKAELAVIDGKTQQVIKRIATAPFAIAVAVNPFTNRIYASGCGSASCDIFVIDGKSDTLLTKVPISSGSFLGIQGLAVNPVTNLIYASDADNGQYIVIDGKTNSIVTMVSVFNQPAGIAVNPKTNRLYVVGGGFPGEVLVFDGATNALLATIPEDFGVENIAVNFHLNRAYVTQTSESSLVVADGATNQNITQVPTGQFPDAVDVNLLNNKVYVANGQDSTVTIIDGNTNQVLQTLAVPARRPTGVAVDLANGLTYVTDFGSNNVVVLQPK